MEKFNQKNTGKIMKSKFNIDNVSEIKLTVSKGDTNFLNILSSSLYLSSIKLSCLSKIVLYPAF